MSRTSNIGLSRKQKVFATIESVMGTLKFPNATTDGILPVGNAVLNQSPEFVNSEELFDSLDVVDQFQNATPAGTFTLSMYLRPSGTVGSAPQGSVLFRALQGSINAATTASVSSLMSASAATLGIKGITGGYFSRTGVVTIGTEKIRYTGLTMTHGATVATLTGCTRGYAATTATNHAADAIVTLSSLFYKQEATSEPFSLWIETDHFVQALSGCSINTASVEISNDGALKWTFEGQGMHMYWAGSDALAAYAGTASTSIVVSDATRFNVGMYVYNVTKGSAKKLISSINATTDTIGFGTATLGASWSTSDVIKGYLPAVTEIGDPVEGHDSSVTLNGVAARIKTSTLSIGVPKQYLTDEIGATYPEDYLENVRDIKIDPMGIYFRKADAKYFKSGYEGTEIPIKFTFGNSPGNYMDIYMPRVKMNVPEINFNPPAIELNLGATALGTYGEDSLEIIIY